MMGVDYVLAAGVIGLIICPVRWDPAIRWKEVQMGIRESFFGKADYTKWK